MKWAKEECIKASLNYEKRSDFEKNHRGAYMSALRNNWLDEVCSHMKPVKIWTEIECHIESLKYDSRSKLSLNNASVYKKIIKNGWVYMFSHMSNNYVNDKRCIYVYEFSDNHVYIGLTKDIERRNQQHMIKGTVFNHLKKCSDFNFIKLTDYLEIDYAINKEIEYVNLYKKNGFSILNKIKAGGIGSSGDLNKYLYWTKHRCLEESMKYNYRSEFQRESQSAYRSAQKNGWLNEICSHMMIIRKPKGYWTFEACKKESLKYKNKNEFQKNNKGAYGASYKNKWLNIFYNEDLQ
jgi:predicted GIY-YIG superfamily endonuclease